MKYLELFEAKENWIGKLESVLDSFKDNVSRFLESRNLNRRDFTEVVFNITDLFNPHSIRITESIRMLSKKGSDINSLTPFDINRIAGLSQQTARFKFLEIQKSIDKIKSEKIKVYYLHDITIIFKGDLKIFNQKYKDLLDDITSVSDWAKEHGIEFTYRKNRIGSSWNTFEMWFSVELDKSIVE